MRQPSAPLDVRVLTGYAIATGVAFSAISWLLIGVGRSEPPKLATFETLSKALQFHAQAAPFIKSELHSNSNDAHELFATNSGPGAVAETDLVLKGVAIGPHDKAALVSINKAAPIWLSVGKSSDGVTLIEVGASKVTVDTPLGFREALLDGARSTAGSPETIHAGPSPTVNSPVAQK